jgi:hypothetical protein
VAEHLDVSELGRHAAEHQEETAGTHVRRDRTLSIVEAVMLSAVALIAAWSGYSAAKWSTESSLSLAQASAARTKASRADLEATQIRTLDSVSFNAVFAALTTHDRQAFRVAVRRLRPGYRAAFDAWLATHPLTNPSAPPGPSYMPQYRIPEQAQAKALNAEADADFSHGQAAAGRSDKYIRVTVFLATVLFTVGISSHFPLRSGRYVLLGVATAMLCLALIQLLTLPGPPS